MYLKKDITVFFEKTNFLFKDIYKINNTNSVNSVAIPAPNEPYFGISIRFKKKSVNAPVTTQKRYVVSFPMEFNMFPPKKPDVELKNIRGIITYIEGIAGM